MNPDTHHHDGDTTWAMQIRWTGGWIAVDPALAADAIEQGYAVRLTDFGWLLREAWKEAA